MINYKVAEILLFLCVCKEIKYMSMHGIRKRKTVDFTEGPIFFNMLRFAMPLMATSVLQALYHAADMVVVGNFAPNGSFAMGAVGASGDINNLLIGSS